MYTWRGTAIKEKKRFQREISCFSPCVSCERINDLSSFLTPQRVRVVGTVLAAV
jgi:hypothetical protein